MAREARIKEVIIPEGNTFSLDIAYQRDGDNSLLPEGCDLLAAFYDYMGQLLKECRLSDGTIVQNQNGTYTLSVSHEDSMRMHRKVTVEVTVINSTTGSVSHAVETVDLIFIPKNNNKIL